jgi:hypothetical protein
MHVVCVSVCQSMAVDSFNIYRNETTHYAFHIIMSQKLIIIYINKKYSNR